MGSLWDLDQNKDICCKITFVWELDILATCRICPWVNDVLSIGYSFDTV